MKIELVYNPLFHPDWRRIANILKPAAALGNIPVFEAHHVVWLVTDGDILAAATARLTNDDFGEIVLCGGQDARRWAVALADEISAWMAAEGMKSVRIYGRKGWGRLLGWPVIGKSRGMTIFERPLGDG